MRARVIICSCVAAVASLACAQAPEPGSQPEPSAQQIADNLMTDMLAQPVGRFTVADLGLPDEFARRVRDRMLIDIFRRGRTQPEQAPAPARTPSARPTRPAESLKLVRHQPPLDALRAVGALHGIRPEARGFIADVLPPARGLGPGIPRSLPEDWQVGADVLNARLSSAGVLVTLAEVIAAVGPESVSATPEAGASNLRAIGFPLDLLDHFRLAERTGGAIVPFIASELAAGKTPDAAVAGAVFAPVRAHDFRVSDEGGLEAIELLRLQIPSTTLWNPDTAGDLIDAAGATLALRPQWGVLTSVSRTDLRAVLPIVSEWASNGRAVTVIEEALPVAQWAQDTAKAGRATGASGTRQIASLVPRYASQNEDGSVFAPNESYMAGGWASAGHAVIQSSLLFQGGNLMAVVDRGDRVLLIGEAEVYRNTALGLSREQVEQLFATEFGVARVVVLPSASFHIDLDLTVRSSPTAVPTVFVNDPQAGARAVLAASVEAAAKAGGMSPEGAGKVRELLDTGRFSELVVLLGPIIEKWLIEPPEGLFEGEDGGAVAARMMVALDLLAATVDIADETDPIASAYRGALGRNQGDCRALVAAVEVLGWKVERVPGLSAGAESVNYLNGLQDNDAYFMPVLGGPFADLDRRVAGSIQRVLGERVLVVSIPSSALQRRAGGLHCVAVAYRREQ